MVEYVVILAVISLATTLGLTSLGKSTNDDITELQGGMDPDASEVVFETEGGERLSRGFYSSYNPIVIPEVPDKEGTSGKYWSLDGETIATVEDIRAAVASGERVSLTPVYTYRLSVTAPRFSITCDGITTEYTDYFEANYPKNKFFAVSFLGAEEKFVFWIHNDNKVITKNVNYSSYVVTNIDLTAVYSDPQSPSDALVVFVSAEDCGQVLSQAYYSTTDPSITFPEAPSTMGKVFVGWSMSEAEIKTAIADPSINKLIVTPVFESLGNTSRVQVRYVYGSTVMKTDDMGRKLIGESRLFTVPATYSYHGQNLVFSHWMDENGIEILGYNKSYNVRPMSDLILNAVYAETEPERVPIIRMSNAYTTTENGNNYVHFEATRSIPDGYTFTRAGILYAGVDRVTSDPEALKTVLTLDGKNQYVLDFTFTSTDPNSIADLYFSTSNTAREYVARGYIVLAKGDEVLEIYSNTAIYASYDQLNNGHSYQSVDLG